MGACSVRKPRFRAPLPRNGPRRFKPGNESDPDRQRLCAVVSLRDVDPKRFEHACNQFVTDNMGLARDFAASYEARHVPLEDLTQAAAIGLLKAIRKFDVTKAFRFSSYAVWWMKHEVGTLLTRGETLVPLPAGLVEDRRDCDWIEGQGQTELSDDAMADAVNTRRQKRRNGAPSITAEKVRDARGAYLGHAHKSIDHKRLSRGHTLLDSGDGERQELGDLLSALNTLPPLHQAVVREAFGLDTPDGADEVEQVDETIRARILAMSLRRLREESGASAWCHWCGTDITAGQFCSTSCENEYRADSAAL